LRSFYPDVYLKSGWNSFKIQKYNLAIRYYKKALVQRPKQVNILLNLAECNIQLKELALATNILNEYLMHINKQKKVAERKYYILLSKIKFEENDFDAVIASMHFAQINSSLSRNEAVFYIFALIKVKQPEQAYRLATKDYKDVLLPSDIHFIRGLYYYDQTNLKDAKTQLELSIKNKTTVFEAYSLLSKIYSQDGNSKKANEMLEKSLPFENQRLINFSLGY